MGELDILVEVSFGNFSVINSAKKSDHVYLDFYGCSPLTEHFNINVDTITEVPFPDDDEWYGWDQINKVCEDEQILVKFDNGYIESADVGRDDEGDKIYLLFDGDALMMEPIAFAFE